jgi:hypothetical protein
VVHHPKKEVGLRHAQQEAQGEEGVRAVHPGNRTTINPQVIMIRASQKRAPTRINMRLLGISKKNAPRKSMPAPKA